MAGGYASHGETYVHPGGVLWWAAGGTLVGDSPARLGFLKRIMTEAPYQDLVLAPELAQNATLLAAPGEYYLLRVKSAGYNSHVEIQLKQGAPYRVDLIDPWQMQVYPLGITQGGLQAFDAPFVPCLLRFRRAAANEPSSEPAPIQTLVASFLKDPTVASPPQAVPIRLPIQHYSAEYTIGELEDNPTTNLLVKKYLPNLPSVGFLRAITVEQMLHLSGIEIPGDVYGLVGELEKTPVAP